MPEFDPERLREWSGGRWTESPTGPVHGFAYDSRRVKRGDLFVCLKTEFRDGHDFILNAAAAGAVGALVNRVDPTVSLPQLVVEDTWEALRRMAAAHRANFPGPVVGISGSCGKTSTKDLLALLLGGAGKVHATEGNLNNLIGVPVTLLGLDPEIHSAAVIEAGINLPGEMEKLAETIQPTAAIITTIAAVHLERLENLETVAREKAMLARKVGKNGVAVFPAACLAFRAFREISGRRIVPGEAPEGNPVFRVEQKAESTEVRIGKNGERVFDLRKVSFGMATDAVLAIEMARELGVTDEEIRERLREWAPAQFRGQFVREGAIDFYVDCYNANPAAMKDALAFFHEVADERARIYVLGCMGELGKQSAALHREVGKGLRLRPQDRVFITGGDVEALREGLLAAGNGTRQIVAFSDLETIVDTVLRHKGYVFMKGSRVYGLEELLDRVRSRKEAEC